MKHLLTFVAATLPLAACLPDEAVSGYAASDVTYRLRSINGQPFAARAKVSFPEEGVIAGQAPCNSFSGSLTAPYPWFATGPIRVTRMACPQIAAETEFFQALSRMTLAEIVGNVLILSTPEGDEMVFHAKSE